MRGDSITVVRPASQPGGGGSIPTSPLYRVYPIVNEEAQSIVVRNHYLHRRAPCEQAFGLFNLKSDSGGLYRDSGRLVGVVMYGTPSSAPLRSGICGPEHALDVYELTRLWIEDSASGFPESQLVGRSLRFVRKPIVVSFADPTVGHIGTVYKATNWIYTGLSAKRTNWTVEGSSLHGHTLADRHTAKEMRERYGDDFTLKPRPQRHRYVYFSCNRERRRELLSKLRYPVLEYPIR